MKPPERCSNYPIEGSYLFSWLNQGGDFIFIVLYYFSVSHYGLYTCFVPACSLQRDCGEDMLFLLFCISFHASSIYSAVCAVCCTGSSPHVSSHMLFFLNWQFVDGSEPLCRYKEGFSSNNEVWKRSNVIVRGLLCCCMLCMSADMLSLEKWPQFQSDAHYPWYVILLLTHDGNKAAPWNHLLCSSVCAAFNCSLRKHNRHITPSEHERGKQ